MARHLALERRIGHRFHDPALLALALTHRSFGSPHNERLEFLGDAVLGCVIAAELYARFPNLPEGALHQMRIGLVRESALAGIARSIELFEFLQVGVGEATKNLPSVLADSLEAVFGSVFLDGGYEAARKAIRRTFGDALQSADWSESAKNPKSRLQEKLHARNLAPPEYHLVATKGPSHRPVFEVECVAAGLDLRAIGSGSSRRRAEQQAAGNLLKQLEA